MAQNGASYVLWISQVVQDFTSFQRVVRRGGVYLVIKVVNEPDNSPLFFVFAKLSGVDAHAGFNGKAVPSEIFTLGIFTQKFPGFFTVHDISS